MRNLDDTPQGESTYRPIDTPQEMIMSRNLASQFNSVSEAHK